MHHYQIGELIWSETCCSWFRVPYSLSLYNFL